MFRRLFCLLFVFLPAMAVVGQLPGVPLNSRTELDVLTKERILLSNYCRMDFEGARLSPGGWDRISRYTSVSSNPDYNRLAVVSRFSVDAVDSENPERGAEALYVTYRVLGYYDELGGYRAAATNEQAEFEVGERGGQVLVTGVSPGMPHVSPQAAVAWMKLRMANPKTSNDEQARLQEAVQQLTKYLPVPRTATPPPGK